MPSDETAAAEPATRRRTWWLLPALIILLLLGFAIFGEKGLLRAMQYRRQQQVLEQRLQELEQANAALRKEIEALRGDWRRIEAIARKELGLVRDDELIYQFPAKTPQAASQPGVAAAGPEGAPND